MNAEIVDSMVESVLRIAKSAAVTRVLVVGCPEQPKLAPLKKKLVYAVGQIHLARSLEEAGYEVVLMPGFTASRTDRLKAALVGAASAGQLLAGEQVLCAVSRVDGGHIDTIMTLTVDGEREEHASLIVASVESKLSAQLLEVLVNLALRIGREGYEGRPVGTLIVVGDSTKVMERSHPLTLNPFQGYSEAERNLFDAHVRDAVRTFAMLDGAFVVRDDGVVLAAGRHLRVGEPAPGVPLGFGARHVAAAAISRETEAIAMAVSQSSGVVRVFRRGEIALEIMPSGRRAELIPQKSVAVPPRTRARKPPRRRAPTT